MDLKQLYQDLIIDHNRSPRNFRKLADANHRAEGFNPLCGDKLTLYVKTDGEHITDVAFEGSGCAISVASASLMTESLKGKTESEARVLYARVHGLLTGSNEEDPAALGKLAALAGVRAYPTRVKCATLCWHTLAAALNEQAAPVSTE
jgi:nitrogen fixation protein NifU and related proteins